MQNRIHAPHSRKARRRAGFSLAELMVVIVIIGLLSTIVAPKLFDRFSKAQVATTKATLSQIDKALLQYRMDNSGQLPDSLEALVTKDDKGTQYLDRTTVPKDGWGNEFVYEINADNEAEVWCFGADGEQGGEGKDADFSNITIKDEN